MFRDDGHVLGEIAAGQQPAVYHRVQRLHAAVEHLGEAGDLADVAHGETGVTQRLGSTAGGDETEAALGEAAGEIDDAGFVGDTEECERHWKRLRIWNPDGDSGS